MHTSYSLKVKLLTNSRATCDYCCGGYNSSRSEDVDRDDDGAATVLLNHVGIGSTRKV